MAEPALPHEGPKTSVHLELTARAADALGHDQLSRRSSLHDNIQRGISDLMDTLGVPGHVLVDSAIIDELPGGRFLRLFVNNRLCRYSNDLVQSIHSYVRGQLLDPEATPETVLEWLVAQADHAVTDFLTLLCVETVKQRSRVLMSEAHVHAYLDTLSSFATGDSSSLQHMARLRPILPLLCELRLSVRDHATVAAVWQRVNDVDVSVTELAEALIDALQPRRVELRLPAPLLRQLTTEWADAGAETFQFVRDALFSELGLRYPDFEFVAADELRPNAFTFTVNHLTVPPFVTLEPTQSLTNTTVDRLPGVSATPAANPATRLPQAVVPASLHASLEEQGFAVWNQLGYYILCLADTLRHYSACFVDKKTTLASMEALELVAPALVTTARRHIADERVTRVLRGLAAEQISVRNLRRILEAILEFDDGAGSGDVLEFVRASLQHQIADRYSRGTGSLVIYLLDPQLEAAIRGNSRRDPAHDAHESAPDREAMAPHEGLLAAVRAEVDLLASIQRSAATPHLLVSQDIRRALHDIIAPEFPRVSVLSFAEIPPSTNVQPVARIGMS